MPTESGRCNDGWDYTAHGLDWECTCIEGRQQSPINLPTQFAAREVETEAMFIFNHVSSEDMQFVWKDGMMKIIGSFGTINDIDGSEFEAKEIRIHTPAEHTIQGKRFDMELQIVYTVRE